MQQSKNYKVNLPEGNNVIDISVLNKNITDIIDKGLILDVGDSTGNANNYVLNLGSITLTSANKGISFKFWADKNSTGAVKINGTYNLVKANGSSITNLKAGAPYIITYDGGTNFFLASGGGLDTVNFTSDKLLTGYSANDSNGEKIDGTMPNKGTVTQTLSVNGSLTLPSGYYDSIKITQNIPNRGEYQMAGGVGSGTDYIALNKIPYGYYPQSSNGWAPEIRAKKTDVANHIGLTANKIVAGNTICGIAGTATVQSLGGRQYKSGTTKGFKTYESDTGNPNHYPIAYYSVKINVGFTPKVIVVKNSNGKLLSLATVGYSFYYFESPWGSGNFKHGWEEEDGPSSLNNTNICIRKIAKYSGSFSDSYSVDPLTWEAWG